MEPDSHPIKPFWLDDIIGEISELSPFAILGSKYDGNAWDDFAFDMSWELLHHLNGNAVYNLTNPLLLHIVSELESESQTDFNAIPFDLRISQMILEGSTGRQCAFIFDRYVNFIFSKHFIRSICYLVAELNCVLCTAQLSYQTK